MSAGLPSLREMAIELIAFVCHRPNGLAISAAVKVSSSRGTAHVMVLAPPREREAVLRLGAQWRNLTSAELATSQFAKRYRHSSRNEVKYELFCFQRWLMLERVVRRMKLSPYAAIAVLDDDILIYRHPELWLRELSSLSFHNSSQM
ncbi:MAG: hypothetical protein SGPRY_002958 [Prymnesium sp.]